MSIMFSSSPPVVCGLNLKHLILAMDRYKESRLRFYLMYVQRERPLHYQELFDRGHFSVVVYYRNPFHSRILKGEDLVESKLYSSSHRPGWESREVSP